MICQQRLRLLVRSFFRALPLLLLVGMVGLSAGTVIGQNDGSENAAETADQERGEGDIIPRVFLPLARAALSPAIQLEGLRHRGVTSFIMGTELDFSQIGLDSENLPAEGRTWLEGNAPPSWGPFQMNGHSLTLDNTIGAQGVYAQFRYADGTTTSPVHQYLFYIPNGDFTDGEGALGGWTLTENGLPVSVPTNGGRLLLGGTQFACSNVPQGSAEALFELSLPNAGSYSLRVEATIHTWDQLPNPNEAVNDAFEVHLNGNVARFGNPSPGLNCGTKRLVPVDGTWSLVDYLGSSATVSLENWSRLDSFYNTFTLVNTVYVEMDN
jgi:hypothetical protein